MNAHQRRKEKRRLLRKHNAGIEAMPDWMQDRGRNPHKATCAELLEDIQRYGQDMKEKEAKEKAEEIEDKTWLGIVAGILVASMAAWLAIIISILTS